MSGSSPSVPSGPRLSAVALLPAALMTAVTLGLAWRLHTSRLENKGLRGEMSAMVQASRAAASRENMAADALRRAAQLEQMLALMRRESPAAPVPDAAKAVDLERVIAFLREEITAAHETIERLKQDGALSKPDKKQEP